MASMKLNATMQTEMVARIDNYCKKSGMTRSAFLSMAAAQYLDALDKQPVIGSAFGDMGELIKLAFSGKTDSPEYAAALERLETKNGILKNR